MCIHSHAREKERERVCMCALDGVSAFKNIITWSQITNTSPSQCGTNPSNWRIHNNRICLWRHLKVDDVTEFSSRFAAFAAIMWLRHQPSKLHKKSVARIYLPRVHIILLPLTQYTPQQRTFMHPWTRTRNTKHGQ